MYTTGDKLLNVMKEEEIGIVELSRISSVPERMMNAMTIIAVGSHLHQQDYQNKT